MLRPAVGFYFAVVSSKFRCNDVICMRHREHCSAVEVLDVTILPQDNFGNRECRFLVCSAPTSSSLSKNPSSYVIHPCRAMRFRSCVFDLYHFLLSCHFPLSLLHLNVCAFCSVHTGSQETILARPQNRKPRIYWKSASARPRSTFLLQC